MFVVVSFCLVVICHKSRKNNFSGLARFFLPRSSDPTEPLYLLPPYDDFSPRTVTLSHTSYVSGPLLSPKSLCLVRVFLNDEIRVWVGPFGSPGRNEGLL